MVFDRYFVEVLPEDKDKKLCALQEECKHVALVGDGANEAPVLVRTGIRIAIVSGMDAAVESADLIRVKSNPMDVVRVLELGRVTHRKIVENLVEPLDTP